MNTRSHSLRVVLLSLTMIASFVPASAQPPGMQRLRVTGSTTLLPVAEAWGAGFGRLAPETAVVVTGGGTEKGLDALLAGDADIALASRMATPDELAAAAKLGIDLEAVEVVYDTVAVIVRADNSVESLTAEQVERLFTGEAASWNQVGGANQEVVIVGREHDAHLGQMFSEVMLAGHELSPNAVRVKDRAAMVARVASTVGAIGFTGLADALDAAATGAIKVVRLFLEPRGEGTYGIHRPLHFYVVRPRQPAVASFIDFVLSPSGQALVVEANFFPLTEPEGPAPN